MSIASVIASMQTNISNAYDSVNTKGGTIPANKNLANLANAIDSISTGNAEPRILCARTNFYKYTVGWETKTWYGLTPDGFNVWTDGEDIYYTNNGSGGILDKTTSTWTTKSWDELIRGSQTWTDGENIYCSYGEYQHIFDKSTQTWTFKRWYGVSIFNGSQVWTDGTDIYLGTYNSDTAQYVLDKSTSTWSQVTWNDAQGSARNYHPDGRHIFTEGENVYFYDGSADFWIIDTSTKTITNFASRVTGIISGTGQDVFTDGHHLYFAKKNDTNLYQISINKTNGNFIIYVVSGVSMTSSIYKGQNTWTDGENLYLSASNTQLVFTINKTGYLTSTKTFLTN